MLIITSIKAYVLLSLMPGLILWLNSAYIQKLSNKILRVAILPFLTAILVAGGVFLFDNIGSLMGDYGSVDQTIKQAQVNRTSAVLLAHMLRPAKAPDSRKIAPTCQLETRNEETLRPAYGVYTRMQRGTHEPHVALELKIFSHTDCAAK